VFASSRRVAVAGTVAGPLLVVRRVGWPVFYGLERFVIGPLTRLVHPAPAAGGVHREELTTLVQAAGGVLEDAERSLLAEVLELRVRRARDVMAPRVDLAAVGEAWTFDEVRALGVRYVPVSPDGLTASVAGTIDARAALIGAGAALIPPAFVPETATLDQVLGELGRRSVELVYCVDELGAITGMVTIDDIVDELAVGAAFGERPVEVGPGVWRVGGRVGVRDLAEFFEVPDIDAWVAGTSVSTVGGLVQEILGRMPEAGDEVVFGGFGLRVVAVVGRAVESLDVRPEGGGDG
jgi:CBS domain containing-hemolysin-like protein